ncbi:hypothetical protein, partial [Mycobacterium sp.]|uniref:hypothetical protein n=1 Tax=Mycobacterium sp. TaxID=1785 RepID=UPI003C769B2F
ASNRYPCLPHPFAQVNGVFAVAVQQTRLVAAGAAAGRIEVAGGVAVAGWGPAGGGVRTHASF